MNNYTANDILRLQNYTQQELNDELHYAILKYNYHNIKVLVSSPELPLHADIYSKTEDEEIWSYMYLRNDKMQDYLMSFDYITDPQEKIKTIRYVCVAISRSNSNTYPLCKLIENHSEVLDNETLNKALIHVIKNNSSKALDELLKIKIDNQLWNNADALVVALLSGSRISPQKILHNRSPSTHSTQLLKQLYNMEIDVWLENMLLRLEPAPDLKKVVDMNSLYKYIARSGNIKLLDMFMQPNKYDIIIHTDYNDHVLMKESIINEQFDFVAQLMHKYGCVLNEKIESSIKFKGMLKNKDVDITLQKVKEIQKLIELKLQLEDDLPMPATNNKKRKI